MIFLDGVYALICANCFVNDFGSTKDYNNYTGPLIVTIIHVNSVRFHAYNVYYVFSQVYAKIMIFPHINSNSFLFIYSKYKPQRNIHNDDIVLNWLAAKSIVYSLSLINKLI